MKLKAYLDDLAQRGLWDGTRPAEDLLAHHFGVSWSQIQLPATQEIDPLKVVEFEKSLVRLRSGYPLAYLIGEQEFLGQKFVVNSSVLIPRPETELMCERALHDLPATAKLAMDLGCGSGCLGLSLAIHRPGTSVHLIDSEALALAVARLNAKQLGVGEAAHFHQAQIGQKDFEIPELLGKVDIIVANPPYIPVGDPRVSPSVHQFEPHSALYAGRDGLDWIHKWLKWGYDYLRQDGLFYLEFGQGQHEAVRNLARAYKIQDVVKDYAGHHRFIVLKK